MASLAYLYAKIFTHVDAAEYRNFQKKIKINSDKRFQLYNQIQTVKFEGENLSFKYELFVQNGRSISANQKFNCLNNSDIKENL